MPVTIHVWHVLALVNILVWAWAILMPLPSSGGSYDFGAAISGLFRFIVSVIATLAIWLVYFIGLVVLR